MRHVWRQNTPDSVWTRCAQSAETSARIWAEHNGCKRECTVTRSTTTGNVLREWQPAAAGGAKVMHLGIARLGHAISRAHVQDGELGVTKGGGGLIGLVWAFYCAANSGTAPTASHSHEP